MKSRTLLELRERIQERASVERAPDRHTPESIDYEVNLAIVGLRSMLTLAGSNLFLDAATGSLSTTPATGRHYGTLAFPSTAERIHSLDVSIGGYWTALTPTTLRDRLTYSASEAGGRPDAYAVDSFDDGTLAIFPLPDAEYPYVLTYQVQHTDLTEETDTWAILPGWDEYVIWTCALQIAIRDADQALERAARIQQERAHAQAVASAQGFIRPPTHKVDRAEPRQKKRDWRLL